MPFALKMTRQSADLRDEARNVGAFEGYVDVLGALL